MLKIFKRYAVVGTLIVLCFFSAFIALCNGLLSTIQASNLIQKEKQYAYNNEVQVTIRTPQSISLDTLSKLCESVSACNVYLENMEVYFDQIDSVYRPNIILKQNEKLSLPTAKSITTLPAGTIVAASSNVSGHDKLSIHGEIFSVYDQMDTQEFPFVTGLFVMNAVDYFRAFPDALNDTNEITLLIASNENDVYSTYLQIQEKVKMLLPEAIIHNSDVVLTDSVFQTLLSQENMISFGLFLFALINTIIISYYWVVVRRHEIAIRKAFGASNLSVIALMAGELLKLVGFSAILAFLVQTIIGATFGNIMQVRGYILLSLCMLLSITLAIIFAMIIPVRYILQIQPSEGVKL